MKAVDQYLERYAVDDPSIAALVDRSYDAAIIVPARDEAPGFIDTLGLSSLPGALLLIVVVNGSPGLSSETTARNLALLQALYDRGDRRAEVPGATYRCLEDFDLVVVDRASSSRLLGPRQGVGRARRIGLDLALRLWRNGQLRSDWLHLTDADATLPSRHFDLPEQAVARVARFWHETDDSPVGRATALYEIWLRAYVVGLAWSRSPWAYHSIGSCISVRAEAYAAVRGVPDREAGEDFHLLAKLAKLGPVANGSPSPLRLAARRSTRVPFGTGPAVARLLAGHPLELFDPRVFAQLRRVHEGLRRIAADPSLPLESLYGDDPAIARAIERIGLPRGLARVQTQSPGSYRHLSEWLDARRTLRLLHALRDEGAPMMSWSRALTAAPFYDGPLDDVDEVRRHLEHLEPRG